MNRAEIVEDFFDYCRVEEALLYKQAKDYKNTEWFIIWPLPGGFSGATWEVWDDQGYSKSAVFTSRADTLVFNDYTHRNTYLHVRVKWIYMGAFWMITPTCGVDLYVGG